MSLLISSKWTTLQSFGIL